MQHLQIRVSLPALSFGDSSAPELTWGSPSQHTSEPECLPPSPQLGRHGSGPWVSLWAEMRWKSGRQGHHACLGTFPGASGWRWQPPNPAGFLPAEHLHCTSSTY